MCLSFIFVALLLVGASAQCEVSTNDRKECGFNGIDQGSCEAKGCCWGPVGAEQLGVPWCFLKSSPAPTPLTHCDGVVHLPTGRHTLVIGNRSVRQPACHIVGDVGAVLEAPLSYSGDLTLSGDLVVEGKGEGGSVGELVVRDRVRFKDCRGIMAVDISIVGPSYGADRVRFANSSTADDVSISVKSNAHVTFTDTFLQVEENSLNIQNSHVIFERSTVFSEYEGYDFTNSTIIASNTSFLGGHPRLRAANSVLNFTNSVVSFITGSFHPGISITNCSVDATCPPHEVVVHDPSQQYPMNVSTIFSTLTSNGGGSMGMDIVDSTVRFAECSCHLDHAISVAGPLAVRGGSMTFSQCQTYGGLVSADPVMLV